MNIKVPARPPLNLIDAEADVLADLALRVEAAQPELAALLLGEIDRATLHPEGALPPHVVSMGRRVTFVDEGCSTRREVRLVYPHDADIGQGLVSVMTPVGAGLIGLAEGDVIDWPDREGYVRRLRIERVEDGV